MKRIILLLVVVVSLYSCKKNCKDKESEVTGIVRDFTGKLDGCKMMIVLSNGAKLEIHSLPAGITLIDGRTVAIKYTLANGVASICMAGDIVDITSLRYL
ncbi:MAG TPA: hypothetical protein PKJ94_03915 [Ferruginibacter sp.]|nr:hypothetical protein [Ferruginibacter sp.]